MTFRYFRHVAFFTTILTVTRAQQSNIVPEDLQGGFKSAGKEVQVSYTNQAVEGFKDGTTFEKDAVAKEPTFALGDSSGITPSTLYTIVMIDTTCPNARKLHYARANFKNNFNVVNIETQSAALLDYKAPGAFGETGDNRQYTFLMYTNPARKQIDQLKLPAEGENFDVEQFQTDNGLKDASAGVGMVVKLGGTANCEGDQPDNTPAASTSPAPAQSSVAQVSSTGVGSTSTSTASSAVQQQPSSAASVTSTENTKQPEQTSSPSSTTQDSEGSNDSSPSTTSLGQTSDGIAVTSVLQTSAPGPSTITSIVVASSLPGGADASGSPTASASLVQQTANAAPGTSTAHGLAMAPLLAIAGIILW
ncbi:Nn.00g095830.m01.CDS01 [Neocucurbitaria sp. VM-36]